MGGLTILAWFLRLSRFEKTKVPDGHAIVDETIEPTVTWLGQVIGPGQIVVSVLSWGCRNILGG